MISNKWLVKYLVTHLADTEENWETIKFITEPIATEDELRKIKYEESDITIN